MQVQGHIQLLPADHVPDPVPHGEAAAQQLRLAGFVAQLRHPALRSQTRAQHSAAEFDTELQLQGATGLEGEASSDVCTSTLIDSSA